MILIGHFLVPLLFKSLVIDTFIQHGGIKLIKVTVKIHLYTVVKLQKKIIFRINAALLNFKFIKRILRKKASWFPQKYEAA